ncbi:MAG: SDR family oxidoreductase [Gammaproteobacteria bacterium]|nr:SDR family oxidoreductase [Gammaproteobacteria bacterium]
MAVYQDKTVWITGASSGIGEALARAFAAEGARLVLSARRQDELERVREACTGHNPEGADHLVLPLDVTDHPRLAEAVATVTERCGTIDVLINNAGISQRSLCVDTEMDVYRHLMEVDVLGQIALTREVLPTMIRQSSGQIAITASVAGKIGVPYRTGYCAAKHAVMGFFDALRGEVVHDGITVHTIVPGYIRTAIAEHALKGDGSELGYTDSAIASGMDPDRCAAVILNGLSRGKPEIPVGEGFEMQALWIKRLFPRLVFKKTADMAKRK